MRRAQERLTVLITGVNGFVGSHLAEACAQRGWAVHGTVRNHRSPLEHLAGVGDRVSLHRCDVNDAPSVHRTMREVQPQIVFHLAAQSFVPDSWRAPEHTLETNVIGTLHILEAARALKAPPTVQIASSSEAYGLVKPEEAPITEAQPLRPLSPYGVSKAACDLLGQQYAASYGLRVVVTRAFNHEGPRRGAAFAVSDWAKQIAEAERGLRPPVVKHGSLTAVRDITDVRDTVQGYLAAVARGAQGRVYNLASGRGHKMGEILDTLLAASTMRIGKLLDTTRMRPSDVPLLIGDSSRACAELGWTARFPLERTLTDTLDYWRTTLGLARPTRKRARLARAV